LSLRIGLVAATLLGFVVRAAGLAEVDSRLTSAGNPLLARYPVGSTHSVARHVGDLVEQGGHLWIAHGSTSLGASIDLWALRLADRQLVRVQENFPQEIIREFRPLEGKLYVASPDEEGGTPNVHEIDGTQVRRINVVAPSSWFLGAHNEDVFALNGGQTLLFPVATTSTTTPANTLISTNGGATWRWATGVPTGGAGPSRFLAFRGSVYAFTLAGSWNYSTATDFMHRYTPGGPNDFTLVHPSPLAAGFPSTTQWSYNFLANPHVEFADNLFYLSSGRLWRLTQMEPAVQVAEVGLVSPFPAGARVTDLHARAGVLYALLNEPVGSGASLRHRATVYATSDGATWSARFRFTTTSRASVSAFARTGDALYFALGNALDNSTPHPDDSGTLLRLALNADDSLADPAPPPLPPASIPDFVVDDFDALRRASFAAAGTGTTGTILDFTGDGDNELRISRELNSAFSNLARAPLSRAGTAIAALRDGRALTVRVHAKAGASAGTHRVRWVVNTGAWEVNPSSNYRGFSFITVSPAADTDTTLRLDLSAHPEIATAAARFIAGTSSYFELILDNGSGSYFSGALEFAIDDVRIEPTPPAPPPPAAGFFAQALPGEAGVVVLGWETLGTVNRGFLLERGPGPSGPWTVMAALSGMTDGFVDASAPPGVEQTYRLRVYDSQSYSAASLAVARAATPLEAWTHDRFGANPPPNRAGPGDDPDGDGRSNLLEYALDSSPLLADGSGGPTASANAHGVLSLTFRRARADIVYVVDGSSDLATWSPIATDPGTVGAEVTVQDTQGPAPRRFLRLRVSVRAEQ
jgi:hypothetical protein